MITHVLLPQGLAVRIGVKTQGTVGGEAFLPVALIGRQGKTDEHVIPGAHSYDGSYSDLKLTWEQQTVRIQSAHDGADLVLLITPLDPPAPSRLPLEIVFSLGLLWNRSGAVAKADNHLTAKFATDSIPFFLTAPDTADVHLPVTGPYVSANLTGPVGFSSGHPRTVSQIQAALDNQATAYRASLAAFGDRASVAEAIQTVIGWDTIYEPEGKRVISPVSRIWSDTWGGYVLFDWDTFFAATMASIGSRDLAYANAVEICREASSQGFVPNFARGSGRKSEDRSEPPVGAVTVLNLYEKFHDRWLLEDTFTTLLQWNRWWAAHRDRQGYLVWGTDPQNQPRNLDDSSVGTKAAAMFESGLDNSPMYDGAIFDPETHQLLIADVGLLSMYVADSDALARIAGILNKPTEVAELTARAAKYRATLNSLWYEKTGIFLNKDLSTGELSHRLSPTNFYPLLAKAATPEQARRMVQEHLLNPSEFWGQWVIPSIAHNDPAFRDQDYWRGRVWGPMNYLVYLGMKNYSGVEMISARQQLAEKSLQLFNKEWQAKGHVHENYNAITGEGDDVTNSDRFYHWGALLGVIDLEENRPSTPGINTSPLSICNRSIKKPRSQ